MKPADDLEQKGLPVGYGAVHVKVPVAPASSWTSEELLLLLALPCFVYSTVGSTYYYYALLPAWEADASLGWTKSSTMLISWASTLAEAIGLLTAGPLSDYVEPLQLILGETSVALVGVLAASLLLGTADGIVVDLLIVNYLKGILWPAVGATVSKTITKEKQDLFFFVAALSSRFAGGFGDFLIGAILNWGWTWRSALLVVFGVDFLLVLIGGFCVQRIMAARTHEPEDPLDPAASPLWVASYGAKWRRLSCDLRGWLALITLVGSGTLWALACYLSVVLKGQFALNSGQAAMGQSVLLIGSFLGLFTAGLMAFQYGKDAGRGFQLHQGVVGVLFVGMLCLNAHSNLVMTLICLAMSGLACGPLMYLPYCLYSATVPKSQRAFCMGTLDCLSQATQVLIKMYFGYLRIAVPERAGHVMYDFFALGLTCSVISSGLLYSQLRGEGEDSHF